MPASTDVTVDPAQALAAIVAEVSTATAALTTDRLEPVAELLAGAERVFVHGAGRLGSRCG